MLTGAGRGGWAWFGYFGHGDALEARARFALAEDGRLELVELHVDGSMRVTGELLRTVPVGSMESWANGRGREPLLRRIREDADEVRQATDKWKEMADRDVLSEDTLKGVRRGALRLRIPEGHKYPDRFYERVAELYRALAPNGRPAAEIAEANGVTTTTVHRWIREARRRGVLDPARHGLVGG